MNVLPNALNDYLDLTTSAEHPLLAQLRRETHVKTLNPRQLSGPYQGMLLQLFCSMLKPQLAVEIGTFTGYSAISIALELPIYSKLISIEANKELKPFHSKYYSLAGLDKVIDQWYGDALELIPSLPNNIGLAFIDANKRHYPQYYNELVPKMMTGGIMLIDNVLWSGKVINDPNQDLDTRYMHEFNTMVASDTRVKTLILPVRDGLTVVQKLT